MVFSAMRAGKDVKSIVGPEVISTVSVSKSTLVVGAAIVLAVIATALIAFVSIGG